MPFFSELKRRHVVRVGWTLIAALVLVIGVMAAQRTWLAQAPDVPAAIAKTQPPPEEPAAARQREKSVAVLPFVDQGSARENTRVFSDGIHDDLLARLSRIHELKVISRASVMVYREIPWNTREIGRELGVAHLLEGRVQQAGQRIRIDVQLIEAATGALLWSEAYDTELSTDALFPVQARIARAVAAELGAAPSAVEDDRLGRVPTHDIDAFRAVLMSRRYERSHGFGSVQRAVRHAREAIDLDPEYADAHVALATALITGVNDGSLDRHEAIPEIEAAIDRALAVDPGEATAWSALGDYRSGIVGSGFTEAFEKALELDPGDAGTMTRYGQALQSARNPEKALEILLRAAELDPLSTDTLLALGRTYATLQRHDRARGMFARIRESNPSNPLGYSSESASWLEQGRIDQGLYWLGRAQAVDPGDFELAARVLNCYDNLEHWGSAAGWSLWLDGWITSQPLPMAMQARHYYLTGEFELALQYANLAINLGFENRGRSESTFMRIKRDEAIGNGDPAAGAALFLKRYPGLAANPPRITAETLQPAVHLGLLLTLDGRKAQARRLLEGAIALYEKPYTAAGPQNLALVPLKAEALAVLGRNEAALAELGRIVEAGWRVDWRWSTDFNASFNGVRETTAFKRLVQRISDDIAAQRERVMAMEADGSIAPPAPLSENERFGR